MARHIKQSYIIIISLFLLFTCIVMPVDTYAASKVKKCTTYRNCLKSGNKIYCTNSHRIFKVDLESNNVDILATGSHGYTTFMKKKGNYIYYCDMTQYGAGCRINRINLKNGEKQILAKNTGPQYVINNNKIYYNYAKETSNGFKYYKRVMKLNGKSKKSTKYKAKMRDKQTNATGYVVESDIESYDWSDPTYIDYYLYTPDDEIFLESYYPMV